MEGFPSTKVLPYVYKGTHKLTGQFYIGYRGSKKQTDPSHLDLQWYRTSSDRITEMGFENFDWAIIAEFFKAEDAYSFEQDLIAELWDSPLKLNGYCDRNKKWNTIGKATNLGSKRTDEQKQRISESVKGKPKSEKHKENTSKNNGSRRPEIRAKLSEAHKGKKLSKEHRKKISEAGKLRKDSEETRRKKSEIQKKP